jgi:cysteine desulfurase
MRLAAGRIRLRVRWTTPTSTTHHFGRCGLLRPDCNDARARPYAWRSKPPAPHRTCCRELLERATATVTDSIVGATAQGSVWTSGGTEAIHHAIMAPFARHAGRGPRVTPSPTPQSNIRASCAVSPRQPKRTICSHACIAGRPCRAASTLRPHSALIDDDTLIVHMQHANHEVGTYQPVNEIAQHAHRVGALVHVDACQTTGQLGFTLDELDADLVSGVCGKVWWTTRSRFLRAWSRARWTPCFQVTSASGRGCGLLDTAAIAGAAVALRDADDHLQTEYSSREVLTSPPPGTHCRRS